MAKSLAAVSALSASDVWAIGNRRPRGFLSEDSLTEHWAGSRWSVVPSGGHHARIELAGVAALSSDDVWAVGNRLDHGANEFTVTEHWNGSRWARIPSPNGSGIYTDDELAAVSGTGPDDVWAVGFYYSPGTDVALTEHWDGTSWSIVETPPVGDNEARLTGVTALAPDDVWAVGTAYPDGGGAETLTEHWNGKDWTIVASPNYRALPTLLTAVDSVSPSDVWAVGFYEIDGTRPMLPVTAHWDGQTWRLVAAPKPPPGQQDRSLTAVSAVSRDDVWAVGNPATTEHWDGRHWTLVTVPTEVRGLSGVAAVTSSDVWAVGQLYPDAGVFRPARLHWDGTSWTSVAP